MTTRHSQNTSFTTKIKRRTFCGSLARTWVCDSRESVAVIPFHCLQQPADDPNPLTAISNYVLFYNYSISIYPFFEVCLQLPGKDTVVLKFPLRFPTCIVFSDTLT